MDPTPEILRLQEAQRWALSEHLKGNNQAVLGMSDALMEEVLILAEDSEDATQS
jgi:hypothetical protein